jgi:hypothetical protein
LVDKDFKPLDYVFPKANPGTVYIGIETDSIDDCEGYYVQIYESLSFGGKGAKLSIKEGIFEKLNRDYYVSKGNPYEFF